MTIRIPSLSATLRSARNRDAIDKSMNPPMNPPMNSRHTITNNSNNSNNNSNNNNNNNNDATRTSSTIRTTPIPHNEKVQLAREYESTVKTLEDLTLQLEEADAEYERVAIRLMYLKSEALEAAKKLKQLEGKIKGAMEVQSVQTRLA